MKVTDIGDKRKPCPYCGAKTECPDFTCPRIGSVTIYPDESFTIEFVPAPPGDEPTAA